MRIVTLISLVMGIFSLFGCENNGGNGFIPQSQQDTKNKKVSQTIHGEVTTFDYSDFSDLKNNSKYIKFHAGDLKVTSGKIVCTDPLYMELGMPQIWQISTGEYPVHLYISKEENLQGQVAYAELTVKEEIPVYWELSLIPEVMLKDDFEKMLNGMYPVEAGLSSFSDYETYKCYTESYDAFNKLNAEGNFYNDVLEPYFKLNGKIPIESRGEDWINYFPENCAGNIIMFSSGGADGLYPRYVGYDKNGEILKFVTDFSNYNP